MTRILLLTILLFAAAYVSGQDDRTIESLKGLLEDEPHDTVKIRLLNSLAIEYDLIDTSESKYMLEKALMLAKKQEYSQGIGLTHETHGKLYFRLGQFNAAIDKYKKAQAQYLLSGDEEKLASVTVDEGNAHLFLSDYNKALNRYNRALAVFERHDNVTGKMRCLNNMGIIYKNYGEYNNALNAYNQVIMLSEQLQDTVSLADTYINMGVVFVHLSSYHRALEHFNKALILAESFGNLKQQTMALMNSGVIHNKLENYSRAYHYYEAALEISRKLKDKVEISKCLSNIGTNYISQGKYELADDYIREGLAIKQELGDKSSIANGYNFLAEIAYHRKNFDEAIALDKKAMKIKREVNDHAGLTRCFSNVSRTFLANNQFVKAKTFADSVILYAVKTGSIEHTSTAYYVKMKVAEKKQAYEDAYHFAELYKQYSDSLLNENKIKAVNNIELQYEAEFLSIENSTLKMQAHLDEEIIKRQRKINLAVTIVIVLIFMLLVFFIYYQRKRSQHYESIQKKNQIITKQNLRLDSLNNTKNTILSVITHDLKGTIGNQLTALSVLGSEEFRNEEERKLVFSRLANSARLSLELLENLSLWTNIQEGKIVYNPERGLINDVLEEAAGLFQESFFNKELTFNLEIDNDIYCNFDRLMLKSVFKNLLGNAIKFTSRGGNITAGIKNNNTRVDVYVKDNGIGMSSEESGSIKAGKIAKMKRGTENEKGSGLGYAIIKNFLEYHDSGINIDSKQGEGTTVNISFICDM